MKENEIIQLMDEDGQIVDFTIIADLKINDSEYAILEPKDSTEDEVVVFRISVVDGEEVLEVVTDEDELLTIEEAYYELSVDEKN